MSVFESIETGVMVMKDGKAWGVTYSDGHSTAYGWVDPASAAAGIHDPEFCKRPTDVTYSGSPYCQELATATLVEVERKTIVVREILITLKSTMRF